MLDILDKIIKKPEVKTDESSFKNNNKGIIVSTINFSIKITAAKTKEMILKNLIRKTKDILGAPKSSRVKCLTYLLIICLSYSW